MNISELLLSKMVTGFVLGKAFWEPAFFQFLAVGAIYLFSLIIKWIFGKKKKSKETTEVVPSVNLLSKKPILDLKEQVIDKTKIGKSKNRSKRLPEKRIISASEVYKTQNESAEEVLLELGEPIILYKSERIADKKPNSLSSKQKTNQPLVEKSIKSKSVQVNGLLKVNYSAPEDVIGIYPLAVFPSKGTVIRSHRYGTTKLRGFKEASFQHAIEENFANRYEVSGDIRLNTGASTRPYEPDIAILNQDEENPIRIDIEVDEPYAGVSRRATHCIGDDKLRDAYFKDRGWVVLRFTEKQVHEQLDLCLAFIARVLLRLDSGFSIPPSLELSFGEFREKHWDLVQAQKWEKMLYRERYLNHQFQPIPEEPETLDREFNEQEYAEEKQVEPSLIGEAENAEIIGFNAINSHQRDSRIKFYPEPHVYTVDGVPFNSASGLLANYFPKFDSFGKAARLSSSNQLYGLPVEEIVEKWEAKGKASADQGTYLHTQIENFYLGLPYERPKEFEYFEVFHKDHDELEPYRSEWRIFDEDIQVAGTIDFIVRDGDTFDIYDWKRSRKIVDTYTGEPIIHDGYGNFGIGPLSNMHDTSFNRYCIQQTIYKHILEKNYGIKVRKMYLIVLHHEYNQYYKVEVGDFPELLEEMIK